MTNTATPYWIELWTSRNGWRWRIRARNGNKLATSENYSSKTRAVHVDGRLGEATGLEVRVLP